MIETKNVLAVAHKAIKSLADCACRHAEADTEENMSEARKKAVEACHAFVEACHAEAEAKAVEGDEEQVQETQKAEAVKTDTVKTEATKTDIPLKSTGTVGKVIQAVAKIMTMPAASKAISDLTADKETLIKTIEATKAELSKATEGIQLAVTEKETLKAESAKALEAVKAEYDTKISDLTKKVEAEKESVSNKVVTELASVGIQQGIVKEEIAQAMTAKEAYNKFASIPVGPARSAFYKANEKLIVQGSHEQ